VGAHDGERRVPHRDAAFVGERRLAHRPGSTASR
jgi:hypothetical protein